VLRRELAGRKPAPKSIAVIADPVFEKTDARLTKAVAQSVVSTKPDTRGAWWQNELERSARDVGIAGERAGFARLPATRAEAQAAVKFAPANSSLSALDFAANQTAATSEALSQYRYVHFATHGVLNNEHPELSGLVLSLLDEKGNDTDGFLRLVEIYNLKLPAEMVTLSACRTGLGKEIKGEGLMSLTRGFMYAGAARVMVSLWDVNDASTAALMSRVYQGIWQEKLSPAAALRKAQNTLRQDKRWKAPFYWAAFTLHGEPR
jgi:CHAT domain-containing protein